MTEGARIESVPVLAIIPYTFSVLSVANSDDPCSHVTGRKQA